MQVFYGALLIGLVCWTSAVAASLEAPAEFIRRINFTEPLSLTSIEPAMLKTPPLPAEDIEVPQWILLHDHEGENLTFVSPPGEQNRTLVEDDDLSIEGDRGDVAEPESTGSTFLIEVIDMAPDGYEDR